MVGSRRLLKIGETVGVHCIFKNWRYGGYPPCIKNLTLQRLSTTCLKLGDMVDICRSFKIGETVGIHPIVKNCDMVGIRRLIEIGETVGIYRIFKNWHYGGYPLRIEKLMIWRVSTPYLKIYNTVCIHSPP